MRGIVAVVTFVLTMLLKNERVVQVCEFKTNQLLLQLQLSFYIITNDDTVFVDIRNAAAQYNSSQLARCGLSSDLFLFRCFKVRIQVLFSGGYLSPRLGRDDWRFQVLCYSSSFLTSMHITCMFQRS